MIGFRLPVPASEVFDVDPGWIEDHAVVLQVDLSAVSAFDQKGLIRQKAGDLPGSRWRGWSLTEMIRHLASDLLIRRDELLMEDPPGEPA